MDANSKLGRGRTRKEVPTIRSLERGLLVLEVLGSGRSEALSDIARATQLSCSTTFRILETLRQRGYVEQDDSNARYRLGFRSIQMGATYSATSPLVAAANAAMKELVGELNETANLAILDADAAVYIHQVEAAQSVRMFTRLGASAPLHCTGVGKVLIAWLPEPEIHRLIGSNPLKSFTATTITKRQDLLAELAQVRQQGFAIDDEERELGVRCVTAPVWDATGVVNAAVSVSAPTSRFPKKNVIKWSRVVCAAADKVSRNLGFVAR